MRILLDQNARRRLRDHLPGHDVFSARQMGWSALENGDLIAAAEAAGFGAMIDRGMAAPAHPVAIT